MVHVAVNNYDFEKINILEYAFGEGGGGHQKAYAVYAFINVDNCERPLTNSANDVLYARDNSECGWVENRPGDITNQNSVVNVWRVDAFAY